MTNIEVRTMEIICHNLPQIAKALGRIADALEDHNSLKRLELTRKDGLDLDEVDMVEKENDNG